jgi:hypothetical protein
MDHGSHGFNFFVFLVSLWETLVRYKTQAYRYFSKVIISSPKRPDKMTNNPSPKINKSYIFGVLALILLFPAISILAEWLLDRNQSISFAMTGKWFIFYAVGFRLLIAGLRQITNPSFTAKDIFHIHDDVSYPIVRELGFANCCFGLVGIISLFLPSWRIVSAFASGLFYGIAGLNHLIKKSAGPNETFAMISDIFIFLVLFMYVLKMF